MKTLRPVAALLIAALFITSCTLEPVIQPDGTLTKKDPTDTTLPVDNGGNTGNNGNTGNTGSTGATSPSGSDSYFPMTSGSTWKYKVTTFVGESTVDVNMTSETETVDNKGFLKAEKNPSGVWGSAEYYYFKDGVYTLRSNINPGVDNEIPMLKDAAVNGTWTVTYTLSGASGQFVGTMKEKNTTRTVEGKTYNNVYHTQVLEQLGYFGKFSTVSTYDFYFAKGVGLIEASEVFNSSVKEKRLLVSYTVK